MKRSAALITAVLFASLVLATLSGCIGVYNNTRKFLNAPAAGSSETEVLGMYGTPELVTTTQGGKVFAYKARNTKYILIIGFYDGFDLIVEFDANGTVTGTKKVNQANAFALLSPVPWAVTD